MVEAFKARGVSLFLLDLKRMRAAAVQRASPIERDRSRAVLRVCRLLRPTWPQLRTPLNAMKGDGDCVFPAVRQGAERLARRSGSRAPGPR